MNLSHRFVLLVLLAIAWSNLPSANALALAQPDFNDAGFGETVEFSGEFIIREGASKGVLSLTAEINPLWHIFSLTQKKNGPIRSQIKVPDSPDFKLIGAFTPDTKPKVLNDVEGFDVPVEEHEGTVTFSAPIELAEGVNPEKLSIKMVFTGQTCESKPNGFCKPLNNIIVMADFGGFDDTLIVNQFQHKPLKHEAFQPPRFHGKVTARIIRAAGTTAPILPGDEVNLEITVEPTDDFHVYAYSLQPTQYKSTIVGFTETNEWAIQGPSLSETPEAGDAFGVPCMWHHHPITWQFKFTIPATADKKTYPLSGVIGMQVCTATGCDPPTGVAFTGEIPIGKAAEVGLTLSTSKYGAASEAIAAGGVATPIPGADVTLIPPTDVEVEKVEHSTINDSPELIAEMAKLYDPNEKIKYLTYAEMDANPVGSGGTSSGANTTFWTALIGAFLGGMLLNLMPCVFPVLGLKVMGFVMQAGSDPKKIRMHGIAFAMGLVVSMWILAGIIMTLRNVAGQDINWGAQMGNPYFVGSIIVLLFLLGLNMAGVFEIGTSLSSVGGNAPKKGYSGSFFSGVLTTLIATPCSGPFLGVAMSYTMAQPTAIAMFLFTIFALGIAFPYLVLSFYPKLIKMLPKPGPWMETFKVIMAFALFATVAFFMQAFGGQTGVGGLSWLAMALVVIGLAAYCYGVWGVPEVKNFSKRAVFGYAMPVLIAGVGFWMCYDAASQRQVAGSSHGEMGGLPWQNWNEGKVKHSLANNGRIIWVDYTADW
jgi:cytochrome c biogenesis protein CcdA